MQFGFNLPNSGALATPEIMACIAREGEALGYDYLTVTDHVALPDMAEPDYPYSDLRGVLSVELGLSIEATSEPFLLSMIPRVG